MLVLVIFGVLDSVGNSLSSSKLMWQLSRGRDGQHSKGKQGAKAQAKISL